MTVALRSEVMSFSFSHALAESNSTDGLLSSFFSGKNPRTLLAYKKDIQDFTNFVQASKPEDAITLMLSRGAGPANGMALAYRTHLVERGLAPATINRRLAALKSLVRLGRILGMITWSLEVTGLRSTPYRDTKGPGVDGFLRMMKSLEGGKDAKSVRDRCIVRLLYGMALRRGELVSLDLTHVDLENGRMWVMGKARNERESLSVPFKVLDALKAWIAVRGTEDGPLFIALDRAHRGHRLDGSGVYRIVSELGLTVGLVVRPHGLRHSAITAALDATHGNARAVQKFSRHKKLETLVLYDDSRTDFGGQVAALLDLGA